MKAFCLALLLTCGAMLAEAQNTLPMRDALAVGGGITMPVGDGSDDFPSLHKGTPSYMADVSYRHYFSPQFALGATYAFNGGFRDRDLIRTHYVAPTLTYRALDEARTGFLFTFGTGYMHYGDRIATRPKGHDVFNKGYFAVSLSLGYEWTWTKHLSSQIHFDFVNAKWHRNEDVTLMDEIFHEPYDPYDPNPDHNKTMFEPKLMFVTLGITLQYSFGKND